MRNEILSAALKIEDENHYDFFDGEIPKDEACTACALGWVAFYLGIEETPESEEDLNLAAQELGFKGEHDFYEWVAAKMKGERILALTPEQVSDLVVKAEKENDNAR